MDIYLHVFFKENICTPTVFMYRYIRLADHQKIQHFDNQLII